MNDVVVIDALPVGLIPLSITAGGNFICDLTENPVNGVDASATWLPEPR